MAEEINRNTEKDLQSEEERRWAWLRSELQGGRNASRDEFVPLDVDKIIRQAKARREARSR